MEKSSSIMTEGNKFLNGENFIIFGEDFARHPHSLEHILRPLFPDNNFIWVETIGLRSPRFSLYDFKRIAGKLAVWFFKKKSVMSQVVHPPNVTVVSPFMIPFNQLGLIRKFNQWMVLKKVRAILVQKNISHPITVASVPNACDYIGHFNEKLKIYFCVDEFSLWPGLDKELVSKLEKKMIEAADIILATSDSLAKTKNKPGQTTRVITHGVDFNHFNIGARRRDALLNKIKICYFGLFDERSDQLVLKVLSSSVKNSEVHIFGNVVCNIKKLNECSNIFFHGPVDYQKLPDAIAEMDVFILPYTKNELTHFINPLKLKEYLSSGRPVVASDLPEVLKLKDYLYIGRSAEDFVDIIKKLQNNELSYDEHKVINYIKEYETWYAKADILSEIIKNHLKSSP